jgi:hypothetical protein
MALLACCNERLEWDRKCWLIAWLMFKLGRMVALRIPAGGSGCNRLLKGIASSTISFKTTCCKSWLFFDLWIVQQRCATTLGGIDAGNAIRDAKVHVWNFSFQLNWRIMQTTQPSTHTSSIPWRNIHIPRECGSVVYQPWSAPHHYPWRQPYNFYQHLQQLFWEETPLNI